MFQASRSYYLQWPIILSIIIQNMKVLIANDIHLGHRFVDQIRRKDSFNAFQQVLRVARRQQVDFLLLGGDLFDVQNPKKEVLNESFELLHRYIYGEREDIQHAVKVKGYKPNFENQFQKIILPIFTIHGNHDYPDGYQGMLSVCEMIHNIGLVNYFGKHISRGKNIIKPIIFQKKLKNGLKAKLALYGLGYIKDCVLNKMYENNDIVFEKPENLDDTFCLFVHHQNRNKGKASGVSMENCIHPKYFPNWMNLTIWAHEHQTITQVFQMEGRQIYQPGSTVITSFIEAQSFVKQAPLLTVLPNKTFLIKPLFLKQSYRPMRVVRYMMKQLFKDAKSINQNGTIQQLLQIIQKRLVTEAKDYIDQIRHINQQEGRPIDRKPIIRIKIEYANQKIPRISPMEQYLKDQVANPLKIFKLAKFKGRSNQGTEIIQEQEKIEFDTQLQKIYYNYQVDQEFQKRQIQFINNPKKQMRQMSFIDAVLQKTAEIQEKMLKDQARKTQNYSIFGNDFKFYSNNQFESDLIEEIRNVNVDTSKQNAFNTSLDIKRKAIQLSFEPAFQKYQGMIHDKFNYTVEQYIRMAQYRCNQKDFTQADERHIVSRKNELYKKDSYILDCMDMKRRIAEQIKQISLSYDHMGYGGDMEMQGQGKEESRQSNKNVKKIDSPANNLQTLKAVQKGDGFNQLRISSFMKKNPQLIQQHQSDQQCCSIQQLPYQQKTSYQTFKEASNTLNVKLKNKGKPNLKKKQTKRLSKEKRKSRNTNYKQFL